MKKSISEYQRYESNPAVPLEIYARGRPRRTGDTDIHHLPDGEKRVTSATYMEYFVIDNLPHFSVYDGWLEKEAGLSSCGMRVFRWICKNLVDGVDEITISPSLVCKEIGYTNASSVIVGVIELLEVGLLFKKLCKSPVYFINVNYIFRGGRTKLPDAKRKLFEYEAMFVKKAKEKAKEKR
jgi:hypothetical protein